MDDTAIAIGNTAEIFSWKDGQVLKLFKRGIARDTVEYEAGLARLVHTRGLPVPAVGEIIEIEGRFGLEYERVVGVSMLEVLLKYPWRFITLAHQLAELQVRLHSCLMPEMPSLKERLKRKLNRADRLPENLRMAALGAVERLPEQDNLCHGDFHPGNILETDRGPVIIDWIDAARGSPLLDVARSTILIAGGPLPPGMRYKGLVRIWRRWCYQAYRAHYFRLNPAGKEQLKSWIPVVAAARLDENITADEDRLLSIAHRLMKSDRSEDFL